MCNAWNNNLFISPDSNRKSIVMLNIFNPPTPHGGNPFTTVPSCSAAINRIKGGNGAPYNWSSIAKGTYKWTDPSFTS